MIIVKITMRALPEKRKELLQTLLSMTEAVRQEKGCRTYKVFQDTENDNVFCKDTAIRKNYDPIYDTKISFTVLIL